MRIFPGLAEILDHREEYSSRPETRINASGMYLAPVVVNELALTKKPY